MERSTHKVVVLTCYYKHKPGGLCKRLNRAMDALVERDIEVHYISATPFPISHANCHYHRFPWFEKNVDNALFWFFFILFTPFFAFYIALKHRVHHCFVFEPTYAFILQPTRMLLNIPLKVFFRADSIENYKIRKRPQYVIDFAKWMEGIGITHSSIYAVSEHCLKNVVKRHAKKTIYESGVIRNDIPSMPKELKSLRVERPIRLSCAGILENRKNQSFLINVFKELPQDIKANLCLNIYGTGPKKDELESLVQDYELSNYVKLHGWREIDYILRNTDLMLIPSLHEGSPNIALETLAVNIPLLASDIPEHQEILPSLSTLALNEVIWLDRLSLISKNRSELVAISNSLKEVKERLTFDWDQEIVKLITSKRLNT